MILSCRINPVCWDLEKKGSVRKSAYFGLLLESTLAYGLVIMNKPNRGTDLPDVLSSSCIQEHQSKYLYFRTALPKERVMSPSTVGHNFVPPAHPWAGLAPKRSHFRSPSTYQSLWSSLPARQPTLQASADLRIASRRFTSFAASENWKRLTEASKSHSEASKVWDPCFRAYTLVHVAAFHGLAF